MPHATTYIVAVHIAGCGCTKKFLQCTYMYDMHNAYIARGVLGDRFGPQQDVEADPEKTNQFKNDKNNKMAKFQKYKITKMAKQCSFQQKCSLHQHL